MLQITKASEVVPMSLYLRGMFFHGGQFQSKPTSPDPLSRPESPSEPEPARWTLSTGTPFSLLVSLMLSFSLMLQKTLNSNLFFGGKQSKRRRRNEETKDEGCDCELVVGENKHELSALSVSFAIFVYVPVCSVTVTKKWTRKVEIDFVLKIWWLMLWSRRREVRKGTTAAAYWGHFCATKQIGFVAQNYSLNWILIFL